MASLYFTAVATLLILVYSTCMVTCRTSSNNPWWAQLAHKSGPGVCVEEQTTSRTHRFYTPWAKGSLCGQETVVKLRCCEGYATLTGENGCLLVEPLLDIVASAGRSGLRYFVQQAERSGLRPLLTQRGAFTVFASASPSIKQPWQYTIENETLSPQTGSQPPPLLYAVLNGRMALSMLQDEARLLTLYRNAPLFVRRFPSGLVTINCIPLVSADLEAANGILHETQTLLVPPIYQSVSDMLLRDGRLSMLATAVARAKVTSLLGDGRSVTLFAPVNDAWTALPRQFQDALMEDVGALEALLRHHMINQVWCQTSLAQEAKLSTMDGGILRLTCNSTGSYLHDAKFIESDIVTNGGVVHLIDKVLIPDQVQPLTVIAERMNLTRFLEMSSVSGLTPTLTRQGAFTIFAPTNQAFDALSNIWQERIKSNPSAAREVIGLHLALGHHLTANLVDGQQLPTLKSNQPLYVRLHRKRITVGSAILVEADQEAKNGILHVIDRVLLPSKTIAELLQEDRNFSTIVRLLNKTQPNFLQLLNRSESLTLFAPDNSAFSYLAPGSMERMSADTSLLTKVLSKHLAKGYIIVRHLPARLLYQYPAWNGDLLTLQQEDTGDIIVARQATVVDSDVPARNGLVHRISRVIHD